MRFRVPFVVAALLLPSACQNSHVVAPPAKSVASAAPVRAAVPKDQATLPKELHDETRIELETSSVDKESPDAREARCDQGDWESCESAARSASSSSTAEGFHKTDNTGFLCCGVAARWAIPGAANNSRRTRGRSSSDVLSPSERSAKRSQ